MQTDILAQGLGLINEKFGLSLTEVDGPNLHDELSWKEHCKRYKIAHSNFGAFYPLLMQSHVVMGTPYTEALLVHEHIGHGLFYEHSQMGKLIRFLEEALLNLEEAEKEEKKKELETLTKGRIASIEGFAVWMEKYILGQLGMDEKWRLRFDDLKPLHREGLRLAEQEEKSFGDYGVIYGAGLPKHYNSLDLVRLCKLYFGQKFTAIDFIILYGSRKPESDIDICVIGNLEETVVFEPWLDMKIENRNLFLRKLKNFDLLALSIIANGSVIFGNSSEIEKLRELVRNLSITREAIEYNQGRAERAKTNIENGNIYNLRSAIKTMVTSRINSIALSQGKKWLRIEDLEKDVPDLDEIIKKFWEE